MTMERIPDIDEALVEAHRQARLADTANGGDDDLNARIDENGFDTADESGLLVDRKDREHVAYYQKPDGSWHPTLLKENDDVMIGGAFPVRVIGAARNRSFFAAHYPPFFGNDVVPINVEGVTDRAPADPNEPPMPVIPAPPEEEPPTEGEPPPGEPPPGSDAPPDEEPPPPEAPNG